MPEADWTCGPAQTRGDGDGEKALPVLGCSWLRTETSKQAPGILLWSSFRGEERQKRRFKPLSRFPACSR